MQDRRQDRATATKITEALHMKNAFGLDAALRLLWRERVDLHIAERTLTGRYDPRQSPG
jgi:hypothetical protein